MIKKEKIEEIKIWIVCFLLSIVINFFLFSWIGKAFAGLDKAILNWLMNMGV